MASGLSPQNEAFITQAIADGLFPSKDAALDAAVEALRKQTDKIPFVPDVHQGLVEEALTDIEKNGSVEMTDADWQSLRQLAHDIGAGREKGID